MSKIVKDARKLAKKAHKGLIYGSQTLNKPYWWHLEKVAGLAERLGYCEEVVTACWLHDTLEDTKITYKDLLKIFPKVVVDAVESVTFDKKVDSDMIAKAKSNPIGQVVKYCDVAINFSASAIYGPHLDRKQWDLTVHRYPTYLSELHKNLPTPNQINDWLKGELK